MMFIKIEPLPHETFYVLADEGADLSQITVNPVCFHPISYRSEIVDPGDIPAQAKIVAVSPVNGSISRVNLETAIRLSMGQEVDGVSDIVAAIDNLKSAMQKNGLQAPVSIELQDINQALKLASMFGSRLTTKPFARLITSLFTKKTDFMIRGIKFNWRLHK